jgi:hypothetical protein
MPAFIDNLKKKQKDGHYDWTEVDNPLQGSGGTTDTVMIPAHGNHPVFDKGGTIAPPKLKTTKSTGKKTYFF